MASGIGHLAPVEVDEGNLLFVGLHATNRVSRGECATAVMDAVPERKCANCAHRAVKREVGIGALPLVHAEHVIRDEGVKAGRCEDVFAAFLTA